ncbi:MAG: MarR family transcriptional regulator [Cyanobacteriota bacterium]|nr:MarR family transcriptional regulator [Cyanobacteriota bacterium]
MPPSTSPHTTPTTLARQEPFLPLIRELARAYQAFASYSEGHVRQQGLTAPQFDVIATLGNTSGMTMHELADKTLVTKGTLTGIIDRLEQKGLVQRQVPPENRRCFRIVLTTAGEAVFEEVFPAHIHHLKARLGQLSASEIQSITEALQTVRQIFQDLPTQDLPIN